MTTMESQVVKNEENVAQEVTNTDLQGGHTREQMGTNEIYNQEDHLRKSLTNDLRKISLDKYIVTIYIIH